jgi:hypothetical protein
METALMSHFGRKAAIAAVAFATVGSTVFGGAALANDKNDGKDGKHGKKPAVTDVQDATAGTGGAGGGNIGDNCARVGLIGPAVIGVAGDATNVQCNTFGNNPGGSADAVNLLGL